MLKIHILACFSPLGDDDGRVDVAGVVVRAGRVYSEGAGAGGKARDADATLLIGVRHGALPGAVGSFINDGE